MGKARMVGYNKISSCPQCEEKTFRTYFKSEPHNQERGYCLNCGFKSKTVEGKLTKAELAGLRKSECYNPRTKKFEFDSGKKD